MVFLKNKCKRILTRYPNSEVWLCSQGLERKQSTFQPLCQESSAGERAKIEQWEQLMECRYCPLPLTAVISSCVKQTMTPHGLTLTPSEYWKRGSSSTRKQYEVIIESWFQPILKQTMIEFNNERETVWIIEEGVRCKETVTREADSRRWHDQGKAFGEWREHAWGIGMQGGRKWFPSVCQAAGRHTHTKTMNQSHWTIWCKGILQDRHETQQKWGEFRFSEQAEIEMHKITSWQFALISLKTLTHRKPYTHSQLALILQFGILLNALLSGFLINSRKPNSHIT